MNLRKLILGAPKSPLDPHVFERLALVAFLAWVGVGADSLSSVAYGPEAAFLALGSHQALAPFLILAVGITVVILTAGYSNTVAAYPGGGGGYIVATQNLGRYPGLFAGCALVVDYVLTVAISVASGIDALLSTLPASVHELKVPATIVVILTIMLLNLRGIKESILALLPIFLGFLITHTMAILVAVVPHSTEIGMTLSQSVLEARSIVDTTGFGALLLILLKAYTVGSGTYTGIEAVSNSIPMLREPRVVTARRALIYIAVSLAFTAAGLFLGYLLYDVAPTPGKTLNAVFLEKLTAGSWFASWFVPFALLTETLLLFVAAQASYVDGPRVLASMATDSWVPRWFRRLSDRLVISNGIWLISLGAIAAVILTGGRVNVLVVLYSFSVFVTFLLTQLGMCVHSVREREPGWLRHSVVNAAGFLLSAVVVGSMALLQPTAVGVAALAILALMILCIAIRLHYRRVNRLLGRLSSLLIWAEPTPKAPLGKDPDAPTAAVLVQGYNDAGLHVLNNILCFFPNHFRNFIFVSVGEIDFDRFKSSQAIERLREAVETDLARYVELVRKSGYYAESRCALGVDVVDEVARICSSIPKEFEQTTFFAGRLLFDRPTFATRLLHARTGEELQRRLHSEGLTLILMPIRITSG